MPLTNIEYGSLASSEVVNDNFEYLDNRITTVAENLSSTSSSIYSNIETMNSTFTQNNEELMEDISDLNDSLEELLDNLNSINNAPDYSKGISISMPYTVTKNGYVYAGVDGIDAIRYVKVNEKPVHGHCGYSGGYSVYSGSLFRVSAGDSVTCDRTMGSYYFYPMKGV